MKPRLPSVPTSNNNITAISPAWVKELIECVKYAMENPRGDGTTILNQTGGTLRAINNSSSGTFSSSSNYVSSFALKKSNGLLYCYDGYDIANASAGLVRIGNEVFNVNTLINELKVGIIYLEVIYSEDSYSINLCYEESLPEDDDLQRYYLRIGEVIFDNDSYSINQIWCYGDIEIRGRFCE